MMENWDGLQSNKLNTKTEGENMAFKIDSIFNWEQLLELAPTSIAILCQLMVIATKKDFSLNKQIPEGGFKFVNYPGSFRACLVQISRSGCEAFMEAHKSMEKIRMYTMQFQQSIRHMVNTLIKGSEEEKTQILPEMFEELKKDADKCLCYAEAIETKFHYMMLLIDETSEATASVKGVNGECLKEALEKITVFQMEGEVIATRKQEMENEKKRALDDLRKAKSAFDTSLEEVPGANKLLLMQTTEEGTKIATGAIDLFVYQMTSISAGITALTGVGKGTKKETPKQSNESETTTEKDNQPELKVAYRHVYTIHLFSKQMYEMFKENTDSQGTLELKVDLSDNEKALNGIKYALIEIKNDYKRSEYAKDPAVLKIKELCKKAIELCDEMLMIKKINADELFQKVKKLKKKSKRFQGKAQVFFRYSPLPIPSTDKGLIDQKYEFKSLIEIANENARYKVELRKKELDDARREQEKFQTEVRKMDEEQHRVLEGLRKTKIDSINFEEIRKTLKDGFVVLSQLQAQWRLLVLFYQNTTSGIDVCLSQKTYNMNNRLRDGRYSLDQFTRDVVLEITASVDTVAYAVELFATAYTNISKKHVVPNIVLLGELIAYDPATAGEQLDRRRRHIDEDCKKVKAEIKALAVKIREDLDKKIEDVYKRFEEQVNKLPPLPLAKVEEIKENVAKSCMSEAALDSAGF